ncbi:TSUP family transporter [Tistrella sp. BH-R2-4]|uniref:Probable membrane transporter protein n=1 Tax=Tistrella arctica TaxID=3133430 RepID=A0ABU9YG26_9PROT
MDIVAAILSHPIGPELLLALFGAAILAAAIDAIAGGGGLVTLPAMLAAGVPPAAAIATNKLQSSVGTATAAITYLRTGQIRLRDVAVRMVTVLTGAAAGSLAVQMIDPSALSRILPVLLVLMALYFLLSPRVGDIDAEARAPGWVTGFVAAPAIGFYDGFFGPGTGSFFMLALVALDGRGMRRAVAETKLLNLTSNLSALIVFAIGGHIDLIVGITMAAGAMIGAQLGARLVIARGTSIVKPLLVGTCLALSLRLGWTEYVATPAPQLAPPSPVAPPSPPAVTGTAAPR